MSFIQYISKHKTVLILLSVLYVVYVYFTPKIGFVGDMECWSMWAKVNCTTLTYGNPSNINYPPGYLILLHIYTKIFGVENIESQIYQLKYIILLFDFIGLYFCYLFLQNEKNPLLKLSFIGLNIAYFYNTIFWGQVDALFSVMVFTSVYFALQKKFNISAVLYALAITFKVQAIIFFPLIGLLYINHAFESQTPKVIYTTSAAFIASLLIICAPFMDEYKMVLKSLFGATDVFPVIAMGARNIWGLLLPFEDLHWMKDTEKFVGLTYRTWGLIGFFTTSFSMLMPFLLNIIKREFDNQIEFFRARVLIIASLIPLLFYFFNTQMHERYSHSAMLFIFIYALLYRKYMLMFLFSIAYFQNLEKVLQFFAIPHHTFIFSTTFIASLYGILIFLLFIDFFKSSKLKSMSS